MKSIIEQASSIMKAIEKAWNQAEQPLEFSIKIFEKEERNFFGMSVKPAKVGIFFGDKPIIHEKIAQKPRPEIKECRSTFVKTPADKLAPVKPTIGTTSHADRPENRQAKPTTIKPAPKQEPVKPIRPTQPQQKPVQQHTQTVPQEKKQLQQPANAAAATLDKTQPRRAPAAWNDAMVTSADEWLKRTLSLMNMPTIQFTSEIAGKSLKLMFNTPLIADVGQEKQLLRSFAHLIMSSLRNQYKQEIKDLKVILIRPE